MKIFSISPVVRLAPLMLVFSVLASCGGGGSSAGTNSSAPAVAATTGYFIDSAVSGLSYKTPSRSGITGAKGAFSYVPGETVTFSIGNITLGTVNGESIITPLAFIKNSSLSTSAIINRIRFLMMLDSDGNPSNGISISDSVRTAAAKWTIDFNSAHFGSDASSIASSVSKLIGKTVTLPTISTAESHMDTNFYCNYAGAYTGNYSGALSGTFGLVIGPYSGKIIGSGRNSGTGNYDMILGHLNVDQKLSATFGGDSIGATFSGTLSSDGTVFSGNWSLGAQSGSYKASRLVLSLPASASGIVYRGAYQGTADASGYYQNGGYYRFAVSASGAVYGVGFDVSDWRTDPSQASFTITGTLVSGKLTVNASNGDSISATLNNSSNTFLGTWASTSDSGNTFACEDSLENK